MERIAVRAEAMLSHLLSFWKGLRDDDFGGYYGYMDQDLHVDRKAVKGCILNSRILWFFSEAAMLTNREDLRAEADHAYAFLREHCIDRENGGVFWSVTYDGRVSDGTKHTYNQAFAVYALSSYYLLTGNTEARDIALSIFDRIESTCRDAGGYLESFTADWHIESNEKLSENGVLADRTMNTLLHVFEGIANLYRATGSEKAAEAMRQCLDIYQTEVYDSARRQQRVFFDADYRSLIDLQSYGHDIESGWLMEKGAALLGDAKLTRSIEIIGTHLTESVYERAFRDGSVRNERERGVEDETRIWWVQAEAVTGFVNLWSKCGEEKYARAAADVFKFIEEKLTDKRPGSEWFWCLDKNGDPVPGKPIVEEWKCPYHNGRMCMELIRRDPEIYV